jgi:general secretion pathway protein D
MRIKFFKLFLCGMFAVQTTWVPAAFAQTVPPEDFLNEDDFDAPPPGTFVPPEPMPPGGNDAPPPPPDFNAPPPPGGPPPSGLSPGGSGGGGAGTSGVRKRRPISEALSDEITNENYPDLIDSFDYPNAEITDIIKAMSELTGKNFIIDPGVRGKITIIAPTKITVAEAWKAFLSALAINGWSIVPSGKFFKVKSARDARNDSIETYAGPYSPDNDQMITRIIHLKHIQAADVNSKLRTLQSKFGDINVYEPTNSLIISDFGSNVERITSILRELDVKGFEEQLEVIQIRYAKAKDIADLMDQIINKGERRRGQGGANAGFTSGIPRFGQPQAKGAGEAFSLVIPDDRTNSIIVVGNKAGIEKIRELVGKLDRRVRPDEAGGVYVYYVKHGDAEKIAQTLSGLATDAKKGQSAAPSTGAPGAPGLPLAEQTQPIFGGEVKIAAAKETNSLIITASRQDYQVILNIMRKIDIPRDQVYVEAIIMEMTAGASSTFNISYFGFNKDSNGLARTGFSSGGLSTLTDITSKGAILGFGSGDKVKITLPDGKTADVTSTLGFVNFLKTVSNVNVLSTPQVLAMDNEEAEIKVQNTIPVAPTTTQGATSTQQGIVREDVGISLKIKPHISRTDETVRLEIENSVSDVAVVEAVAQALATQSTSTSKRNLKSQIVVRNGDTAVLGGLMKDQETEQVSKVPLLGDIPILGWLFKGKTGRKEKVNLLIFLTPRILRSSADRFKLLGDKMVERNDYVRTNFGGRDPFGTQAEKLARRADEVLKQEQGAPGNSGEQDIPLNEDE